MKKEEKLIIYENQRYIPLYGFSTYGLLPTDRNYLSNQKGSPLPTELMEKVEELYNQQNYFVFEYDKDKERNEMGWNYAFNWPNNFSKKKSLTSYVRKRILYFPSLVRQFNYLASKEEIEDILKIKSNLQFNSNTDDTNNNNYNQTNPQQKEETKKENSTLINQIHNTENLNTPILINFSSPYHLLSPNDLSIHGFLSGNDKIDDSFNISPFYQKELFIQDKQDEIK